MTAQGHALRRRRVFLAVVGLLALGLLVAAREVLLPFVLAAVIAYVLTPAVEWFERRRAPRPVAILIVYVIVLGSIGLFIRLVTPRLAQEVAGLRKELPTMAETVRSRWVPGAQRWMRDAGLASSESTSPPTKDKEAAIVAHPREDGSFAIELEGAITVTPTGTGAFTLEAHAPRDEAFDPGRLLGDAVHKSLKYAQHNALEVVRIGRDIVAGISRFFFVSGITLMLAAYMILTRERILGFFRSLVRPSDRPSFALLLWRVDRGLSGVVRGQLIICVVNGVLSAIGFAIVGLKYWPVLALVATVLSLIPIFGSIISTVPAVALGLTQGLGTAVFVLVWIIGIHQMEANVLNPKIMGDAAKIHPVLVVFALFVGEHFFHTVGALLAVPCMSIAQSLFLHFREVAHKDDPEMAADTTASVPPPPPA